MENDQVRRFKWSEAILHRLWRDGGSDYRGSARQESGEAGADCRQSSPRRSARRTPGEIWYSTLREQSRGGGLPLHEICIRGVTSIWTFGNKRKRPAQWLFC